MTEIIKKKRKKLSLPKKAVERLVQSVIDAQNAENEAPEALKTETPAEKPVLTQENAPTAENARENETQVVDIAPHRAVRDNNEETESKDIEAPELLWRDAVIEEIDRSNDGDTRTISLSFSSETPVQRGYGKEVLSHNPSDVDLTRLNTAGPVLLDHNTTKQVGVVQKAWIGADKKGRAKVKFSKNQLGTEVWNDIQDDIKRNVSVGYEVNGKPTVTGDVYRWKWTPSHIAMVSEPADITVGINRGNETTEVVNEVVLNTNTEKNSTETKGVNIKMSEATVTINKEDVLTAERNRVKEIQDAARKYKTDADVQTLAAHAENSGYEVSRFHKELLDVLSSKKDEVKAAPANIGLTAKQARSFSVSKMVNHLLEPTNKKLADEAGFEIEVSKATRDKFPSNRTGITFSIPNEVMNARQVRTAVDASTAADLIETQVLLPSFIDFLYNQCQVSNLGATHLDGLVNTVQIPRRNAASTAYWLATDVSALTESEGTFDDITLSPKTLTGFAKISRQALGQIPGIDAIVSQDLARSSGVALDEACISGAGSGGVPGGLSSLSLPTIALGTNGAAPTWAAIMKMVGSLISYNALFGSLGFLSEAYGFETLTSTLKDSTNTASTYICGGVSGDISKIANYKYVQSQNVPSSLKKGTEKGLSALYFGNWNDAVIASWGAQEILVDPYTFAANNQVAMYNFGMYDFNVRHVGSFAQIVDMVTTNSASS